MLLALAVVHAAAEAASRTSGSGRATTATTTRGAYRPTRTGSPARASTTSSRDALLDVPAPRLTSRRAPLRLCDGGESLPATIFSEETLCLEQPLPGVTRGEARNKGLHAASVNVTFAGTRVDPTHVTAPTLIVPSEDGGEDFLGPDAEEDEETTPKPDDHVVDVFVRFNLNVAGLPTRTKGTLEASVEIEPLGRFYYDIVWYELSVTYPTFYSHQVEVTVQEGIDQDKSEEEIEADVEDLKEGSATFFPCTNFIAGPFCDEAGISA